MVTIVQVIVVLCRLPQCKHLIWVQFLIYMRFNALLKGKDFTPATSSVVTYLQQEYRTLSMA